MEKIKELFVVVENTPGSLGKLLGHLVKEEINIEAIGLFQDIPFPVPGKITAFQHHTGVVAKIRRSVADLLGDALGRQSSSNALATVLGRYASHF